MSYSITGGDPGKQFSVGESTGGVRVREALDREAASSYSLVSTVQYSTVQYSTVVRNQEHEFGLYKCANRVKYGHQLCFVLKPIGPLVRDSWTEPIIRWERCSLISSHCQDSPVLRICMAGMLVPMGHG